MIRLIGLTGGIGSGKSTIARIFRDHGVPVIDADVIARQVTEPGQVAYRDIARAWPEVVGPDGQVDRKRLAVIVFANSESRKRLEAITHPRIRAEVAAQAAALETQGRQVALFEAALLVETGSYRDLDGLILVIADPKICVERIVRRDSTSHESALARIAAQLPVEEKIRAADHVIDNGGTLEQTTEQVLRILHVIRTPRG
jgi:dephospho-CoA kinase